MKPTSPTSTATPDLWHSYGAPASQARPALPRIYWDWYQNTGPDEALLGDVAGRDVADLGAGSARQAAYLAQVMKPARIIALDSSATRHARSVSLYGNVPRLELIQADAATYLAEHPGSLDIAYSIFGAVDFCAPKTLLPAVAVALRPGGRLIFSTLGHYSNGAPPATECLPTDVPMRLPDGSPSTLQRWVLDTPVWEKVLDGAGFDLVVSDTVHDLAPDGGKAMTTCLFVARRRGATLRTGCGAQRGTPRPALGAPPRGTAC
ncbi:class I SAM-dependent methyltransferase [Streptomyces sp. gb1(2016)]|uniref:Class I SAM-dependent methyltransferase n=1 Tax=Streptomyces sp. gb1(2016) TaxID=1828321 RepID=A0A652LEP5_9ACTN|nr:class I SAM-dependent methyltransferase [Streptomyces sp. gb1(2016)]TXS34306.1 class I SAM-dependent methyltransferase [Streptomyces sp. gb1(2016)]